VKKRGRPATGRGEQVQVRLQPLLMRQLDLWRENRVDSPTRPEAIRRLIALGLSARSGHRTMPLVYSPDDPD
jgi:hypothetical protein